MAYINRKPNRRQKIPYKHVDKSTEFYNSKSWKDLRNLKISLNPLCEECLKHDVINPAEQVHHKRFILSGNNEIERWQYLLDYNNLMSLCTCCHKAMHRAAKYSKKQYIDKLSLKQYNDAHYVFDDDCIDND